MISCGAFMRNFFDPVELLCGAFALKTGLKFDRKTLANPLLTADERNSDLTTVKAPHKTE